MITGWILPASSDALLREGCLVPPRALVAFFIGLGSRETIHNFRLWRLYHQASRLTIPSAGFQRRELPGLPHAGGGIGGGARPNPGTMGQGWSSSIRAGSSGRAQRLEPGHACSRRVRRHSGGCGHAGRLGGRSRPPATGSSVALPISAGGLFFECAPQGEPGFGAVLFGQGQRQAVVVPALPRQVAELPQVILGLGVVPVLAEDVLPVPAAVGLNVEAFVFDFGA